jgi:hypothetical protein
MIIPLYRLSRFLGPPSPDPIGTVGSFSGVKWPGREADQSPALGVKVKKT